MSGDLRLPFAIRISRTGDIAALESTLERARNEEWATRLADKDVTLWSQDPAVQAKIANRLGWLDAPTEFTAHIPALEAFGDKMRDAGFTTAIVAGMGGSSLAPEVLATAFAEIDDWLKVRVCDSTDPSAVAAALRGLDPASTLVIVASKSGTTTETLSFAAYAAEWLGAATGSAERALASMIAISDPSPCIDGIPGSERMLERFLNPPDIGGRYSALSFVGLVPASLLGIDLDPLLASGSAAIAQRRDPEPAGNHALALGCIIGALAREGRDKMTLIVDAPIDGFGAWAEQLVAESTGKLGVGVVPVDGEPLGRVIFGGNFRNRHRKNDQCDDGEHRSYDEEWSRNAERFDEECRDDRTGSESAYFARQHTTEVAAEMFFVADNDHAAHCRQCAAEPEPRKKARSEQLGQCVGECHREVADDGERQTDEDQLP